MSYTIFFFLIPSISAQFQHTNPLLSYKWYSTIEHTEKDSFAKKPDFEWIKMG